MCKDCISWAYQWAAIILLYVFSLLLFVLETDCVYCLVRLESLTMNQVNILISGFPCHCHSTNAPYFSFTCCRFQKDKRAKSGNLKNNQLFFGNRRAWDVLAMSQAVSHGRRIAEAWIRSRTGLCWDLWLTELRWDWFFYEYFGLSLSQPVHQRSVPNFILIQWYLG